MGRQVQEREIGDYRFMVEPLNPFDAQDLVVDVLKTLAPAVGTVVEGGDNSLEGLLGADTSDLNLGKVVKDVIAGLDKHDLRAITKKLMACTKVSDGQKVASLNDATMDRCFRGELLQQMQWLIFALEVQLRPLWDEAPALFAEKAGSLGLISQSI